MPTGLGGERLWLSATNDNTGTSTAFNDQSGSGNNGTASGTTVVADTGSGGTYAYNLDGSNDYISVTQTDYQFLVGTNYSSMSAWVKADSISGQRTILGGDLDGNDRGFFLANDSGNGGIRSARAKGYSPYTPDTRSSASLTVSQWSHVCWVVNDTTSTLYLDGVQVFQETGTFNTSISQLTKPIYIGRYSSGSQFYGYLDGLVDDVRVYDRAITQEEITHLASSRGVEGSPFTGLGGEQLWLCPSLNNSPSDISGNGNDGTYVGSMVTIADTDEGGSYAYNHADVSKGVTLPADLGLTADDGAISIWVKSTTTQSSTSVYSYIGAYDQTYTNSNPVFYTYGNKSTMADRTQSPNAVPELHFENPISYNSWRHLCLVKDNGVYTVYKDGVLVSTSSQFTGDLSFKTTVPWAIGKGFFDSFIGLSDDARIYNRAISQAEITHLATSRGIQGAPQVLNYENTTNVSGVSIQSDVDVDGINLLQTDGDIQDIEIKIKWSNASSWQGCECYVIDPDGSYHYLFSAGSLPFGSGSRVDSMTISSGSFPLSMDGTWEFHLSDQMFNSNTIDEVSTDFEVIQTNMPDTYSEVSWYGGGFYRGGVDLSGNTNHVYPHNSASIVADTGSNGTNAFSFSSSSSQRWSDGIVPDYNSVSKWSVSAWIKAGQTLASKAMIFCNHGYRRGNFQLYQAGDEFGLFLGYYDPAFSFGDAEIITTTNVNITTGSWYNIIATFDGGAATQTNIYVNGASAASSRQTVAAGISVLPLNTFAGTAPDQTIGAMKDAAGSTIYYPFDGEIDACRTVNLVYTSDDITWLASGRNVAGGPTDFKSYYKTNQSSITGFPNA